MITIGHIVGIIVSKAMLAITTEKIEKRKVQNDSKILEN